MSSSRDEFPADQPLPAHVSLLIPQQRDDLRARLAAQAQTSELVPPEMSLLSPSQRVDLAARRRSRA